VAIRIVDWRGGTGYKTIQSAVSVAIPGDTIQVNSGTYRESVEVVKGGTRAAPITIIGARGVIVESAAPKKPVFTVRGKNWVSIRDMILTGGKNGVAIDKATGGVPSTFITVQGCYISQSLSSGVRCAFSEDITIANNTVTKTNRGGVHEMISVIGTRGFSVSYNEVFNGEWSDTSEPIEGKEGIDIKDGSSDGVVEGNTVRDLVRLGIYVDAWDELTQNITIRGNTVTRCKQGIALSSEAGGTLRNVTVSENVTVGNVNYGIIVAGWRKNGPRENISLLRNVVSPNGRGGIAITTKNITGLVIE
jgi:parallel beta-helix repeat protein